MVPKEFENISRQADLHANDALSSTSEESDSSSDSDASVDTETSKSSYRKLRNKKRRENVARYIMEQGAIRVIENICKCKQEHPSNILLFYDSNNSPIVSIGSRVAILLIHYRDVSNALRHNILESEDELINLFQLWHHSKKQYEFEEQRAFENLSKSEQDKIMLKRKHEAATKIQYQIRKFLKRRKVRLKIACTNIQRIVRGFLARKAVARLRAALEAEQEALWTMAENAEVL